MNARSTLVMVFISYTNLNGECCYLQKATKTDVTIKLTYASAGRRKAEIGQTIFFGQTPKCIKGEMSVALHQFYSILGSVPQLG